MHPVESLNADSSSVHTRGGPRGEGGGSDGLGYADNSLAGTEGCAVMVSTNPRSRGLKVRGLAVHPLGGVLACACSDGIVRLWRTVSDRSQRALHRRPDTQPRGGMDDVPPAPDAAVAAAHSSLEARQLWPPPALVKDPVDVQGRLLNTLQVRLRIGSQLPTPSPQPRPGYHRNHCRYCSRCLHLSVHRCCLVVPSHVLLLLLHRGLVGCIVGWLIG